MHILNINTTQINYSNFLDTTKSFPVCLLTEHAVQTTWASESYKGPWWALVISVVIFWLTVVAEVSDYLETILKMVFSKPQRKGASIFACPSKGQDF